ncbi:tripartite tricarboxylate transporter substrate binding protein [Paracidovorax wautersii]|uniref:Tripartite-type tricarboxylate transporter receptor subunit TctC n=1 Tax=Paracidovorax wautersii TaxID=1177982 RepID=A0ABU1IEA0_9BURK|nr:tripartite tricarboxylate transporter substrate binding protein [Paracidovorax wautersii]MDR6214913.1 tripartite-type tricarboxylate transporter receptor subunit TctC [Paracidovorax wautersii]
MLRSRFLASTLLLGALALTGPAAAWAQAYPDRPVKLVIPFAPGGATDILGRLLATALGERLGQPMVVENKPGAGTVVAASMVAKAPADGYTLLLGANTTLTLNPAIRNNLPYDPLRSFTPLGLVADMGLLLVAHNDTPGSTLKEAIALTKAAPDKYSYGSYGTGSSVHFGGEVLKSTTGMRMMHVPFNGSSPNLTALMGGQVQYAVDTVVASTPLIQAGKIKAIAALSPQRLALLPQVPTVAESGYPGFDMGSWFAFVAPAGLPEPVRKKLEKALQDTMASAEFRKKLEGIGLTPTWGSGEALRARVERELPLMRAVAARADIRVD